MPLLSVLLLVACNNKAPENPLELLEVGCHRGGDPEACFKLGTKELNAPQPDYANARKLFSMGCGVHHAPSCNSLGNLVRDARGGPKDIVRARNLYDTSCQNGLMVGCVHYADVLLENKEEEGVLEKALELYTKACDDDPSIPKACTSLGSMYKVGDGVEKKDEDKALELFEKACKAEYAPACVEQANIVIGKWGKENTAAAAELYDKACTIDANFGCFELAVLHHEKKAPDATMEQAGHYYERVCSMDHSRGCYELAELMAEELVPSRPGQKEALYTRSCESGNSEACSKR
ncbi:MAG: sel1 repeat family protein [Alphaproteobacteria bacterium]|nr:sel1 repeat family protein [Alphaproteobacteria bacterium]